MSSLRWPEVRAALGPGILYAGASIGTSHLVQATRAGAMAGLGLAGVVLAALLLKLPFFELSTRYTVATGTDLIRGYRLMGRWPLAVLGVVTVMTGGLAGVALTRFTAYLMATAFGGAAHLQWWVAGITTGVVLLILLGHYRALDALMKLILALLAASTFVAACAALPRADLGTLRALPIGDGSLLVPLGFLLALVGWMPAPIDVTAWHSLWTAERSRQRSGTTSVAAARSDMLIGYTLSGVLAFCFLFLGAAVMYGSRETMSASGTVFSTQLVDLYGRTLGAWARPLVWTAVLTAMFSTVLAVADAVPRTLAAVVASWRQGPHEHAAEAHLFRSSLVGLGVVTVVGNAYFSGSFTAAIDLATILAFLTAPVLAILTLRLSTGPHMPENERPGPWLRAYAWFAIGTAIAFSVVYLFHRLA